MTVDRGDKGPRMQEKEEYEIKDAANRTAGEKQCAVYRKQGW